MKTIVKFLILLLAFTSVANASPDQTTLGTFGQAKDLHFTLPVVGSSEVWKEDAVCVSGDVKLQCDNSAAATSTNCFVDRGANYSLALTAAETRCRVLSVLVKDQDGPLWGSTAIHVYNDLFSKTGTLTNASPSATVMKLAVGASAIDDTYKGMPFSRLNGVAQTRCICGYNGSTREATLCGDGLSDPADNTTDYAISLDTCETVDLGTVASNVSAIQAVTFQMGFSVAGQLDVHVISMATDSLDKDAIKADAALKIAAFTQRIAATAVEAATYTGLPSLNCYSFYGMVQKQMGKSGIVNNFWDVYQTNGSTLLCHTPISKDGAATPIIGQTP